MALYNLYAGMTGSFNNVEYCGTQEFNTAEEADEMAHEIAIDIYQSYEGCYGLYTWDDCRQELEDEGYEYTDEDVNECYEEEVHRWIDFYAILASEDPNNPALSPRLS